MAANAAGVANKVRKRARSEVAPPQIRLRRKASDREDRGEKQQGDHPGARRPSPRGREHGDPEQKAEQCDREEQVKERGVDRKTEPLYQHTSKRVEGWMIRGPRDTALEHPAV